MNKSTIAFIGAGHMGCSLIGGLINNGFLPEKIWATNPDQELLARLKQQWGIQTTINNITAAKAADVIVFAVKPQIMSLVANELAQTIETRKPLVISIAAGISTQTFTDWLGPNTAIVRCMPNTPALVGSGATVLYASAEVTEQQREEAESILRSVGITVWVSDEQQIDIVTALSGSGPAYFLLVMEALEKAAIELGLPKETSRLLTLQTALGAARLALESSEAPAELRRHITSPGGTTEQAVKVLEAGNIQQLFSAAVKAAQLRSIELSRLFVKS